MKYQKPLAIVGGLVIAGGLFVWLRQTLIQTGGENTRGVTSTGTAGIAQGQAIRTTPIQTSDVAVVAPQSTLSLLLNAGGKVLHRVSSIVLPVTTDRLQQYGNPKSAQAAYTSPIRADYKPSSYATIKPR